MSNQPTDANADIFSMFGDFTEAGAQAAKAAAERNPTGVNWGKINPGSNLLRILPPKPGRDNPLAPRWTHYLRGGEKIRQVPCIQAHRGQRCPICEDAAHMDGSEDAAEREEGKELRVQSTHLVAAVDMNAPIDPENPAASVKVYELKRGVVKDIAGFRTNPRSGGNYSHPFEGFPLEITKEGQGMQTRYSALPCAAQKGPIHPDEGVMRAILSTFPDVFALTRLPTLDEVEAIRQEWQDEIAAKSALLRGGGRSAQAMAASLSARR